MAAHQAPPSLGFSRQEHWMGCHFLLQCMEVKSESEVAQSCLTLSDPMDCRPPGSSVQGILQARVLEWGAIALGMLKCLRSLAMVVTYGHRTAAHLGHCLMGSHLAFCNYSHVTHTYLQFCIDSRSTRQWRHQSFFQEYKFKC